MKNKLDHYEIHFNIIVDEIEQHIKWLAVGYSIEDAASRAQVELTEIFEPIEIKFMAAKKKRPEDI